MADDKKYYYLKVKENFFDSEQMIVLETMQDGYLYCNILLKLYLRSLKNQGKLMFNDRIPYNSAILAQVVRHPVGVVEKAIGIFKEFGLIDVMDNGAIYILDIQNFIGTSSSEADRQRDYQRRIASEKGLLPIITRKKSNRESNRKTTPEIELDLELDLEKDLELKKEKEIQTPHLKKSVVNSSKRDGVKKYAEYVYLKPAEYEKLKEAHGDQGISRMIEILDSYKANNAKKRKEYEDDYRVILSWVIARYKEEQAKVGNSAKQTKSTFDTLKIIYDEEAENEQVGNSKDISDY